MDGAEETEERGGEANDGGDREKKRQKKRERMKGERTDEEGSKEE